MYIIVCKDDLGGWIECGRYDDQDDAIEARDSLQMLDPAHTYKIMTDDLKAETLQRVLQRRSGAATGS